MLSHLICLCLQTRKFTTCAVTSNSNPSDCPRAEQPRAKFPSAYFGTTSVSVEILIVLIYQKGSSEVSGFIWLLRSIKKGSSRWRFSCPEDWCTRLQPNSCLTKMVLSRLKLHLMVLATGSWPSLFSEHTTYFMCPASLGFRSVKVG